VHASAFPSRTGLKVERDVFQAQAPSVTATGLSAGDSSGLAVGGAISMALTSNQQLRPLSRHHSVVSSM